MCVRIWMWFARPMLTFSCGVVRGFAAWLLTCVMSGKHGIETDDANRICLLEAPKGRVFKVGGILRVAVAINHHATVYASGIGLPHIHVQARSRFACGSVDDLNQEGERHAFFPISDVASFCFGCDEIRTCGNIWLQNARRIFGQIGVCEAVNSNAGF